MSFATAGDVKTAKKTITVSGALGEGQMFTPSKNCPLVSSQGRTVLDQGKVYIWHGDMHGGSPFFVDPADVDIKIKRGARSVHVAAEVQHYVPYFDEQVTLSAGMAALTSSSSSSSSRSPPLVEQKKDEKAEELSNDTVGTSSEDVKSADKVDETVKALKELGDALDSAPVSAYKVRSEFPKESYPEGPPEDPQCMVCEEEGVEEEMLGIPSDGHNILTHLPKSNKCKVCLYAKLYNTPARRFANMSEARQAAIKDFEPKEPLDLIYVDLKVIKKGGGGRTQEVSLNLLDGFSGATLTYALRNHDKDSIRKCYVHFAGRKSVQYIVRAHSDCAGDLIAAAEELGWIAETSAPNRRIHNPQAERNIRTTTEGGKCNMVQANLPEKYWHKAERHFSTSLTFFGSSRCDPNKTRFEAFSGHAFRGFKIPFGSLVHYKADPKSLGSYEAPAKPGLFLGYALGPSFRWTELYNILDYGALLQGKFQEISVREVVLDPERPWRFPLAEAKEENLSVFKGLTFPHLTLGNVPEIPAIGPLRKEDKSDKGEVSHSTGGASSSNSAPHSSGGAPEDVGKRGDGIQQAAKDDRVQDLTRRIPRANITIDRFVKFRASPDCPACELGGPIAEEYKHTQACRRRFDRLVFEEGHEVEESAAAVAELSSASQELAQILKPCGEVQPACIAAAWFSPQDEVKHEAYDTLLASETSLQQAVNDTIDAAMEYAVECERQAVTSTLTELYEKVVSACPAAPSRSRPNNTQEAHKVLVEFCCAPDSNLCETASNKGLKTLRLCESFGDLHDPAVIEQLVDWARQQDAIHLHGSLPCTVWSAWQQMAVHKYGQKYAIRLQHRRQKSLELLDNFVRLATVVREKGGTISFEWPRYCVGWAQPRVMKFVHDFGLEQALFDGCAFDMKHHGQSILKPWKVVSDVPALCANLSTHRCQHPSDYKHAQVEGSLTAKTAFYNDPLCECMLASIYPQTTHAHVPALICTPVRHEPHMTFHRQKDNESIIDRQGPFVAFADGAIGMVIETDDQHFGATSDSDGLDFLVPAAVTTLLSRHEMLANPDAIKAVKKEADGLASKNTWDLLSVKEAETIKQEARKSGRKVHLGSLMTICSVKFAELAKHLQVLKGRVVFRGDNAKDEWGAPALYQELAASPTSIQAANANIAYGLIPGHKTTCADAVKAYVQSHLKSEHPTWISLPPELWPPGWKGRFSKPMVRLIKSLYGHPESGAHWQAHLEKIIRDIFGGKPVDGHPSSYWIAGKELLLTVYVDDLMLSGPEQHHQAFWDELIKHVELEEITPLERFLGRHHEFVNISGARGVQYDMSAYAAQTVEMYQKLTGNTKLRAASTPFVPEGSLVAADDELQGEVSPHACAIIMKMLWLARLSRPDLLKPISDLATKIQCWTRNNDKQLYRLACYIDGTKEYRMTGYINDPKDKLSLKLFADADFAGDREDAKSTSGSFLAVVGPNSFFPLQWSSRKQTSVSRSTTESEVVSLAAGMYNDALPMLSLWDTILGRECQLEVCEDNQATITVVNKGYSAKLRHISRTHKVNLAGLSELFHNKHYTLSYIDTKLQASDIFTKALSPQLWAPALKMLGLCVSSLPSWSG